MRQDCLTVISHLALCRKTPLNLPPQLTWDNSGSQALHSLLQSQDVLERKILLSTQSLQGIPQRNVAMFRSQISKKRIGSILPDFHIKLKHYISARGHPLKNVKYMFQFRDALQYLQEETAIKKWHKQLFWVFSLKQMKNFG